MHSLRAWAPALALVVSGLVCSCGDDEVAGDAGVDASMGPDAEDLCPGQLTFEALVADAVSGEAAFEVLVEEVGGSAMVMSAPNGRAPLCLPDDRDSRLSSSKTGYLTRLDTVSREAVVAGNAAAQPYPLEVLTVESADALMDGLGVARDEAAALLLVSVHSYPGGEALEGAEVAIDADNDGVLARDADGGFDEGGEIAAGGTVLFANVATTGGDEEGRAAITINPPRSFSGTCVGPPSVELVAGGVSGAFFACQ